MNDIVTRPAPAALDPVDREAHEIVGLVRTMLLLDAIADPTLRSLATAAIASYDHAKGAS